MLVVAGTSWSVPAGDFLVDSGFTKVCDLSRGTFIVLQRADASVVGYSREGITSSIVGIEIDGETGLGIP
jgi:hypothetical protein